jgi:hypothetical protein
MFLIVTSSAVVGYLRPLSLRPPLVEIEPPTLLGWVGGPVGLQEALRETPRPSESMRFPNVDIREVERLWAANVGRRSFDSHHNPKTRTIYFQLRCHQSHHGLSYL